MIGRPARVSRHLLHREVLFNEPGSDRVRDFVRKADVIHSSHWSMAEFHSLLHRRQREGVITRTDALDLSRRFAEHAEGVGAEPQWNA